MCVKVLFSGGVFSLFFLFLFTSPLLALSFHHAFLYSVSSSFLYYLLSCRLFVSFLTSVFLLLPFMPFSIPSRLPFFIIYSPAYFFFLSLVLPSFLSPFPSLVLPSFLPFFSFLFFSFFLPLFHSPSSFPTPLFLFSFLVMKPRISSLFFLPFPLRFPLPFP